MQARFAVCITIQSSQPRDLALHKWVSRNVCGQSTAALDLPISPTYFHFEFFCHHCASLRAEILGSKARAGKDGSALMDRLHALEAVVASQFEDEVRP